MRSWSKETRILVFVNSAVLLCLAAGWGLYAVFGHRLVEAIYNGESIEFLNGIISGQHVNPLEHYLSKADHMMRTITLATLVSSLLLSLFIKYFPLLSPFLHAYGLKVLTLACLLVGLSVTAVAFFYPLEIETREANVWIYALALKEGINVYDHTKVAFVNMSHGPFDPFFKFLVATAFPFLESWQVTRFAVFMLPYAFLLIAWRIVSRSCSMSRWDALYLASLGYLFLLVSAKDWIFVGRSDATAAILFLLLIYACFWISPRTELRTALHGLCCGVLGTAIILTNWRITPNVLAVFLFASWVYRYVHHLSGRRILVYLASGITASVAIWVVLLYEMFKFDFGLYYKHFFALHLLPAELQDSTNYTAGSVGWFLLSLFNPAAHYNKGGPLLLALSVYALAPPTGKSVSSAWLLLSSLSFLFCATAYYLTYWGGGAWYFIPFLIILWFYLCDRYSTIANWKRAGLGVCVAVLMCFNFRTVVSPSLNRATRMEQAYDFMGRVRSLQHTNTVLSEDTFFYRKSYQGELIDMGDTISWVAKTAYFGREFDETAARHFARLVAHPPDYIITGFTGSPELKDLIEKKYTLVAKGPKNLSANGGASSILYKNNELMSDGK